MARLLPLLLLVGCGTKSIGLGLGAEHDARLVANLYTWPCASGGMTDSGATTPGIEWEGVFNYDVTLEYAPDALLDRGLPDSGCVEGLDLFARDAGAGGLDIPDAAPVWSNGEESGVMARHSPGFYGATVFNNEHSCQDAQDLLGEGTLLSDAGVFSGKHTPTPGVYESVTLTGDVSSTSGLEFGATVTAEWEASDWSDAWVQLRREDGGSLVESVTCRAEGNSFTVDKAVWALTSSAIRTDVTNLYVAVENSGTTQTDDGQYIEVITRAMHVAVVQD